MLPVWFLNYVSFSDFVTLSFRSRNPLAWWPGGDTAGDSGSGSGIINDDTMTTSTGVGGTRGHQRNRSFNPQASVEDDDSCGQQQRPMMTLDPKNRIGNAAVHVRPIARGAGGGERGGGGNVVKDSGTQSTTVLALSSRSSSKLSSSMGGLVSSGSGPGSELGLVLSSPPLGYTMGPFPEYYPKNVPVDAAAPLSSVQRQQSQYLLSSLGGTSQPKCYGSGCKKTPPAPTESGGTKRRVDVREISRGPRLRSSSPSFLSSSPVPSCSTTSCQRQNGDTKTARTSDSTIGRPTTSLFSQFRSPLDTTIAITATSTTVSGRKSYPRDSIATASTSDLGSRIAGRRVSARGVAGRLGKSGSGNGGEGGGDCLIMQHTSSPPVLPQPVPIATKDKNTEATIDSNTPRRHNHVVRANGRVGVGTRGRGERRGKVEARETIDEELSPLPPSEVVGVVTPPQQSSVGPTTSAAVGASASTSWKFR